MAKVIKKRKSKPLSKTRITDAEALAFHLEPTPGKFEITATVPMTTQRDLSLAYSPGVAVPCEAIAENPETAYDYTNKGNLVAVISNGTGGSWVGQPWGPGVQAGDGRQGGSVQTICRCELHRY